MDANKIRKYEFALPIIAAVATSVTLHFLGGFTIGALKALQKRLKES